MLTFAEFAAANRLRCERDFGRQLGTREAHHSMQYGLSEEAGEVAGKMRTLLGFTTRKSATARDVAHEIADVVSYADLLAQSIGMSLEEALIEKFNIVSDRTGSAVKL